MTAVFSGKRALVTGAATGLGLAFTRAFLDQGAAVALVDLDEHALKETVDRLRREGARVARLACDVSDARATQKMADQAVDELGGLDILVNNAGLHSAAYNYGFAALGIEKVRRLFDVNLMGVVNCALACRSHLAASGTGTIVNIASIAAYENRTAYGVSKLAVRGATISLAHEFAPDGIRVNAIAPGLIGTKTAREELPEEMFRDYADTHQLVHRTGREEDIVAAMAYLCSPQASFITGETLRVSGGYPLLI